MSYNKRFVALLDANVLYPAPLRDFLLRLAQAELFTPRWSVEIHDEWTQNLLKNRSDLKPSQLEKTRQAMDSAFPTANVTGYKSLISDLRLPDANDRHVLAAAIKGQARIIITANKRDFPSKELRIYGIDAQTPDTFVCALLAMNKEKVLEALRNLLNALKNPPQTMDQVLQTLKRVGLSQSVAIISRAV
ncbi:MAG: PIN domain-containing protein [Chitinophaga sp.]|uniref:PIN domain-containing protein n=1 Tax=Chitinophaga sp. TaxID=1869181 RepID=UPI0025BA46B9|nr:PIN domain-containing protein [Chitinophaga sp.]MBV8255448.1 PIN domain-containing protein [Chitinophaga sp.]